MRRLAPSGHSQVSSENLVARLRFAQPCSAKGEPNGSPRLRRGRHYVAARSRKGEEMGAINDHRCPRMLRPSGAKAANRISPPRRAPRRSRGPAPRNTTKNTFFPHRSRWGGDRICPNVPDEGTSKTAKLGCESEDKQIRFSRP